MSYEIVESYWKLGGNGWNIRNIKPMINGIDNWLRFIYVERKQKNHLWSFLTFLLHLVEEEKKNLLDCKEKKTWRDKNKWFWTIFLENIWYSEVSIRKTYIFDQKKEILTKKFEKY